MCVNCPPGHKEDVAEAGSVLISDPVPPEKLDAKQPPVLHINK